MELVVHRAAPFRVHAPGGSVAQPRAFVHGQIERFVELVTPDQPARTLGLRFRPHGAWPILGVPLSQLTGTLVPLEDLWGSAAADVVDRALEAPSEREAIGVVERALLDRLDARRLDLVVARLVELTLARAGCVRVSELARRAGLSERQVERRFRERIGLAPKQLARIVRLQRALRWIGTDRGPGLTAAALACGYYDQAHFIRDVRRMTGLTPSRCLDPRATMARLFAAR
jgi:AraC-like DNA-binding protein